METALLYGFAAAGAGFTLLQLRDGVNSMEGQHWVMLAIIAIAFYVLGRVWAAPAQMVGLP
jgi:hypothetical protein